MSHLADLLLLQLKRIVAAGIAIVVLSPASAVRADESGPIRVSEDPYADSMTQHKTEVEPVLAADGDTIVAAFQVGRFFAPGSENIGWATSKDAGKHWQHGFLTGTTIVAGGSWLGVSIPSIAFDRKHHTFLIQSVPFDDQGTGRGIYISRSSDGINWSKVSTVAPGGNIFFSWIACDNHVKSAFYGNCYGAWTDFDKTVDELIVSNDGGNTWSSVVNSDQLAGAINSIAIQPNGNFVLLGRGGGPNGDQQFAIQSVDGGHSLNATVFITTSQFDYPYLRSDPTPTSAVDRDGTIYVIFSDCRFRPGCPFVLFPPNDLVMTTSTNGVNWSAIKRIPIDPVTGTIDHVLPGVAALSIGDDEEDDDAPKAGRPHIKLALTYYSIDNAVACVPANCDLNAEYISSDDGGVSWHHAREIAGPMMQTWLATTYAGQMVTDYLSPVFVHGKPWGAFALAHLPDSATGMLDEAIYAVKLSDDE